MTVAYVFGRWDAASPACTAAPDIPSDEVFRRIANGDRLAMRTLFVRYRVPVYRWLLRIVGDAAVAEDLLNDAFLDVWRNATSFDGRSSVSTWLLAVARDKTLSARRSKSDAEPDEVAPIDSDMSEDPELARQQKEEVLRHCLARLLPDHREVLDLVYFHRKWIKEVAQIVGTDEQTVRARMCDARKRLAELVELCTYALALNSRSSFIQLHPLRPAEG